MKSHEFLIERIINLHTAEEKAKYVDDVWEILQKSYQKAGGFKSAVNKEELIDTPGYWKLVTRDGQITAVNLYRKVPQTQTYKIYASGAETVTNPETNEPASTPRGNRDYKMVKLDDTKQKRAWAEVSGAPEIYAKRSGAKPIPNSFAAYLTGKEIIDLNPDGYHYTRIIMGKPHEKVIYGFLKMTPEQEIAMQNSGIDLKDLPK